MNRRLIPILLVAACAALIQSHSIHFWTGFTSGTGLFGSAIPAGVVWSLALEGAALWLWWRGAWLRGALASLLLLAGPAADLLGPIYSQWQQAPIAQAQHALRVADADAALSLASQGLRAMEANSLKRSGWDKLVSQARAEVASAVEHKRQLLEQAPATIDLWQSGASAIYLLLALAVAQTAQVSAVRSLRGSQSLVAGETVESHQSKANETNGTDLSHETGADGTDGTEQSHGNETNGTGETDETNPSLTDETVPSHETEPSPTPLAVLDVAVALPVRSKSHETTVSQIQSLESRIKLELSHGKSPKVLMEEYKVPRSTLYRWAKEVKASQGNVVALHQRKQ